MQNILDLVSQLYNNEILQYKYRIIKFRLIWLFYKLPQMKNNFKWLLKQKHIDVR